MELVKREDHYGLYNEDGHKIAATIDGCNSKLSKENCDEIFGVVDVEKLAEEEYPKTSSWRVEEEFEPIRRGYLKGYNKAMELNKDKLFTMEDVDKIFTCGKLYQDSKNKAYSFQNVLNKLRQPTEIEVEIVTHVDLAATPVDSRHPDAYLGTDTGIPFLDENGCLILSKKK
jgi:dipeptidase